MDIQFIINSKTGKGMRKYNPGEQEILFEVPVIDRKSWLEKQIEAKIENIGDFEKAMIALEKVKFGE